MAIKGQKVASTEAETVTTPASTENETSANGSDTNGKSKRGRKAGQLARPKLEWNKARVEALKAALTTEIPASSVHTASSIAATLSAHEAFSGAEVSANDVKGALKGLTAAYTKREMDVPQWVRTELGSSRTDWDSLIL